MSHHAQLVLANRLSDSDYLKVVEADDTELSYFTGTTLAIADVRNLIKSAFIKPQNNLTKTIVIEVSNIAVEAQQALLKVIEEPPATTKFVIVVPSKASLLPTLLSRLNLVSVANKVSALANEYFLKFLQLSYSGRIELIAKLTKDKKITEINDLASGALAWTGDNFKSSVASQLYFDVTRVAMRGAAKKMLLEDIALLLPVE